jgi:TDG/mug DNA glycosylase family protein
MLTGVIDSRRLSKQVKSKAQPFAHGIADLVGPDLAVLFCGINPGRLSGELGQHFARPGNRFWKLLHAGGFTDRVLVPSEQGVLPALGIGITNLVERVTAAASELDKEELRAGAGQLESKVRALRPRCVAVLGLQAYRTAFQRPHATIGEQQERLGTAKLWLLPNPSGLQARYQLPEMTDLFKSLHRASFGAG